MKRICLVHFILLITLLSCSDSDPAPVEQDGLVEPMEVVDRPTNVVPLLNGEFTGYAHNLSGEALVFVDNQGKRILRFEEFTMTAGPDVYVLFSKTSTYSTGATRALSMLGTGYSQQSIQFEIPANLDLAEYKYVLVYCVQFSSLFGYTELQ
jgi:hypothetical protein